MLFQNVMLSGMKRHSEAIAEARAAGIHGAQRLPATVLFPNGQEISDTGLVRCLDALEEGRAERDHAKVVNAYIEWLATNRHQLDKEIEKVMAEGCADISEWLKNRFQQETGVRP